MQLSKENPRQFFLSVLALSTLQNIEKIWGDRISSYDFEYIRPPEIGMVMLVARTGSDGEPFNLGEVTMTRCAVRLDSGENGFGYLRGRDQKHAATIAVLDALAMKAQQSANHVELNRYLTLAEGLNKIIHKHQQQQSKAVKKTRVNFYTMVRGDD